MPTILIDNTCIKCQRCVKVCPAKILYSENEVIKLHNIDTCISCGHCVAVCPTSSVRHSDFPDDKVHEINRDILPSPDSVLELIRSRRSNRAFSNRPIPLEFIDKILEAANRAPTASNKQLLRYTVITEADKVKMVSAKCMKVVNTNLAKLKKPLTSFIVRKFVPSLASIVPMLQNLSDRYASGYDPIARGATAMIVIHGPSGMFQLGDGNLAYQNASLMAESLGVSQFYMGFVCVFSSPKNDKKQLVKKYLGINDEILAIMALGMPALKFKCLKNSISTPYIYFNDYF